MGQFDFGAYVADARFDGRGQAFFALGDGTVRGPGLVDRQVHDGAVLCAALHPGGEGVLTGGDDGAVCWTTAAASVALHRRPGRWVDALAASPASGLFAFACGRDVFVRDAREAAFERSLRHERSVAALTFDPKGRRLAAATYGGVALWYARIAEQTPHWLKWAGAHIGVAWSPDGRFVVSTMQENALHGWRLADGKDMRMGGYPAKVRSLAFLSRGRLLATSGAAGAVVWPFTGADGPMGKEAAEVGAVEGSEVTCVAAAPSGSTLVLGRRDGSVHVMDLTATGMRLLGPASGAPVVSLSVSPDGSALAFGTEAGRGGVLSL